jgi:hypothetical protein
MKKRKKNLMWVIIGFISLTCSACMTIPFVVIERPFISIVSFLKFGTNSCSIKPKKEIVKLENRPALLMHSRDDSQVSYKNFEILLKHAPPHIETFIREGDLHFIIENFEHPEKDKEYSDIIMQFINKHFSE